MPLFVANINIRKIHYNIKEDLELLTTITPSSQLKHHIKLFPFVRFQKCFKLFITELHQAFSRSRSKFTSLDDLEKLLPFSLHIYMKNTVFSALLGFLSNKIQLVTLYISGTTCPSGHYYQTAEQPICSLKTCHLSPWKHP